MQILNYDQTVRQSRLCHPDWTPRDHAKYLFQEAMTLDMTVERKATEWRRCREAVARVLNVTPCHGLPWANNGRTMPVFVTRGRMAMSHVEECLVERCGTARPVGSTFQAD